MAGNMILEKLPAYRVDKIKINLSDAGKLYDYLTENTLTDA
jgi:hypothetical protein